MEGRREVATAGGGGWRGMVRASRERKAFPNRVTESSKSFRTSPSRPPRRRRAGDGGDDGGGDRGGRYGGLPPETEPKTRAKPRVGSARSSAFGAVRREHASRTAALSAPVTKPVTLRPLTSHLPPRRHACEDTRAARDASVCGADFELHSDTRRVQPRRRITSRVTAPPRMRLWLPRTATPSDDQSVPPAPHRLLRRPRAAHYAPAPPRRRLPEPPSPDPNARPRRSSEAESSPGVLHAASRQHDDARADGAGPAARSTVGPCVRAESDAVCP